MATTTRKPTTELMQEYQVSRTLLAAALDSMAAFNPCDYHAGHVCRDCAASITDTDYIAAGLYLGLCSPCLSLRGAA